MEHSIKEEDTGVTHHDRVTPSQTGTARTPLDCLRTQLTNQGFHPDEVTQIIASLASSSGTGGGGGGGSGGGSGNTGHNISRRKVRNCDEWKCKPSMEVGQGVRQPGRTVGRRRTNRTHDLVITIGPPDLGYGYGTQQPRCTQPDRHGDPAHRSLNRQQSDAISESSIMPAQCRPCRRGNAAGSTKPESSVLRPRHC